MYFKNSLYPFEFNKKFCFCLFKNIINLKNLFIILTYLSVLIVIFTLAKPGLNLIKNYTRLFFIKNKNTNTNSNKKFRKISSSLNNCSFCKKSSSSEKKYCHETTNKKHLKLKKNKHLNKKYINNTLHKFKID